LAATGLRSTHAMVSQWMHAAQWSPVFQVVKCQKSHPHRAQQRNVCIVKHAVITAATRTTAANGSIAVNPHHQSCRKRHRDDWWRQHQPQGSHNEHMEQAIGFLFLCLVFCTVASMKFSLCHGKDGQSTGSSGVVATFGRCGTLFRRLVAARNGQGGVCSTVPYFYHRYVFEYGEVGRYCSGES
jgi:hypothetical protein